MRAAALTSTLAKRWIPLLVAVVISKISTACLLMPTKVCSRSIFKLRNLLFLAADLFRSNGQPDTAYHTLIRAAKHAEPKRPEASIEFYQKAANMYRLEGGRVREAADVLNRVACLQIRDINFDNLEKHIIDIYAALNYKFKILISPEQGAIMMSCLH